MSLSEVRSLIESERFAAEVGIASGYRLFEECLYTSPAFRRLIGFLRDDPLNVNRIVNVTRILSEQRVDYRYQNPNDTALAAYVKAIKLVSVEGAEVAAAFSINAQNTWWSRQVAERVLKTARTAAGLSSAVVNTWDRSSADANIAFRSTSNTLQSSLVVNLLSEDACGSTVRIQRIVTNRCSSGPRVPLGTSRISSHTGSSAWEAAA